MVEGSLVPLKLCGSPLNAYRLVEASLSEGSTEVSDADIDYGDERVGKQQVAPGKFCWHFQLLIGR